MRPAAGHKNGVSWMDDAFKRFRVLEKRESFKIRLVCLDVVIVEQMTLVRWKQYPALSPNQLREPGMRSPYVMVQRSDGSFGSDENARIDQTHKWWDKR